MLRTCDTQESYRVMMTSNQAGDFILRERKNNLSQDEPLVLEFDAFTIPPKFFWESHETIGPASAVKIARGTCAVPGTEVH